MVCRIMHVPSLVIYIIFPITAVGQPENRVNEHCVPQREIQQLRLGS